MRLNTDQQMKQSQPSSSPSASRSSSSMRRWCFRMAVLAILGAVGYFFLYPQGGAWFHLWRANQAVAQQDWLLARNHWKQCLEVWRDSGELHFQLARSWRRDEFLDNALLHLRQAERHGWPKEVIELERILVAVQTGRDNPNVTHLRSLVQENHADSDMIVEALAMGLWRAKRFDEAETYARMLVELQPDQWRAHTILGKVLENRHPAGAAQAYLRSLEIHPDQPLACWWLARHQNHIGQPEAALKNLAVYRQAFPKDAEADVEVARSYYKLGKIQEAKDALSPALAKLGESHAGALGLRALVELETGDPKQALLWSQKAEALAPFSQEVLQANAQAARVLGDETNVAKYEKRLQQLMEDRAAALSLQQQFTELQHGKAPEDKSKTIELSFKIGNLMFRTGQDREALEWMSRVLHDDPYHKAARLALADFFDRQGDSRNARQQRLLADKSK
jgi:tetratricopeptide (TPR) repeat protein